jgi:hypothetical protein
MCLSAPYPALNLTAVKMAILLSQHDFDRLSDILSHHSEWQLSRSRDDFMIDVLAGSPRRTDLRGLLDLEGAPRPVAVRTIHRLMGFGQDLPGREALGVLVNKLIANLGDGDDADFLRDLLGRYPFSTSPVAAHRIVGWHGKETDNTVAEKIIGENTLRDIYFLEVLLDLSRAVVRIRGPQTGTGFLIGEDLLITNHHVIPNAAIANDCMFHFNYQLDHRGNALPVHTARKAPGGLFQTSPMASHNATAEQLDYTILQLADVPKTIRHLELKPTY